MATPTSAGVAGYRSGVPVSTVTPELTRSERRLHRSSPSDRTPRSRRARLPWSSERRRAVIRRTSPCDVAIAGATGGLMLVTAAGTRSGDQHQTHTPQLADSRHRTFPPLGSGLSFVRTEALSSNHFTSFWQCPAPASPSCGPWGRAPGRANPTDEKVTCCRDDPSPPTERVNAKRYFRRRALAPAPGDPPLRRPRSHRRTSPAGPGCGRRRSGGEADQVTLAGREHVAGEPVPVQVVPAGRQPFAVQLDRPVVDQPTRGRARLRET